jgi:hypothetical protein
MLDLLEVATSGVHLAAVEKCREPGARLLRRAGRSRPRAVDVLGRLVWTLTRCSRRGSATLPAHRGASPAPRELAGARVSQHEQAFDHAGSSLTHAPSRAEARRRSAGSGSLPTDVPSTRPRSAMSLTKPRRREARRRQQRHDPSFAAAITARAPPWHRVPSPSAPASP